MTVERVGENRWALRSREGTLLASGTLYEIVSAWARLKRDGWSDVPFGQPLLHPLTGERTTECTTCLDCGCRACTQAPLTRSSPSLRTR